MCSDHPLVMYKLMRSELILGQSGLQIPKKLYRKTYSIITRSTSAFSKKSSHLKPHVKSVLLIKFDSRQILGVEKQYY